MDINENLEPAEDASHLGRRDLIAKAVAAGAIVWGAPLVISSTAGATNPAGTCPPAKLYAAKFHRNLGDDCWNPASYDFVVKDNNGVTAINGCNRIDRRDDDYDRCNSRNRLRTTDFRLDSGYTLAGTWDFGAYGGSLNVTAPVCYTPGSSRDFTHEWTNWCSSDDRILIVAFWGPA